MPGRYSYESASTLSAAYNPIEPTKQIRSKRETVFLIINILLWRLMTLFYDREGKKKESQPKLGPETFLVLFS